MYDNVPPCWYLRVIAANDLTNAAANTVSHHCAAQRLLYAHAEAAALEPVRAAERQELLARSPLAAAVYRLEFGAAKQPQRPGISPRRVRPA